MSTKEQRDRIAKLYDQFESKPCGRCGGSGQYSYCPSYGSTCFQCRGRRIVLTARGVATQQFFESLCKKPTRDLAVGEQIRHMNITVGGDPFTEWAVVLEVRPWNESDGCAAMDAKTGERKPAEEQGWIIVVSPVKRSNDVCTIHCPGDELQRLRQLDADVLIAKYEQAIAYQSTLTTRGTVRVKGTATTC